MAHDDTTISTHDRLQPGSGFSAAFAAAAAIGVVGIIIALLLGSHVDAKRFNFAYLIAFMYFLTLAIGGLFFVLMQHVTKAGWSASVRRIAEIFSCTMPVLFLLSLPIIVSVAHEKGTLYCWALDTPAGEPVPLNRPEMEVGESATSIEANLHTTEKQEMSVSKRAYLNPTFFIARLVIYFAVWSGLSIWYWRRSIAQDASGDAQETVRMQAFSAPAMIIFALITTLAAFDLLMSLDPNWYSTIFGVYIFAGCAVSFFASAIVVITLLQACGYLKESVSPEHFHDLGKWMFAFTFFWGYIAFSQFMLQWYAAIPEEVEWYSRRGATTVTEHINGFSWIALALLFCNLFIPFLGLLSRHVKRKQATVVFWAVWLLVTHYLDLYWIAMPELDGVPHFGLLDIACFVGVGGIFIAAIIKIASKHSLRSLADPRLSEALAFQNI